MHRNAAYLFVLMLFAGCATEAGQVCSDDREAIDGKIDPALVAAYKGRGDMPYQVIVGMKEPGEEAQRCAIDDAASLGGVDIEPHPRIAVFFVTIDRAGAEALAARTDVRLLENSQTDIPPPQR